MTFQGIVKNGVIVADQELAEGEVVEIRTLKEPAPRHRPDVEQFAGIAAPLTEGEDDYYEHLRKKHA